MLWLVALIAVLLIAGIWLNHHLTTTPSAAPPSQPHPRANRATHPKPKNQRPSGTGSAPNGSTSPSAHHSTQPPPKLNSVKPPTLVSHSETRTTYYANYQVGSGGPVNVNVTFSGTCWIDYWINGTLRLAGGHTYYSGQQVALSGTKTVKLWIGDVFAASIKVDGADVQGIASASHGRSSIVSFIPG
jgi:hypothetical protein